jgi:FkbM family methyltransferase
MLLIYNPKENKRAINFCELFINASDQPKFIFGRNEYAESVANKIIVDGFIDDFTSERRYLGKPIYKTEEIPKNALVLVAVVLGRPLTAKRRLDEAGVRNIDYFSFYRYSGLKITPVTCWNDFLSDFHSNKVKYEEVFGILADEESKETFISIINFKLSAELSYMEGFTDRQSEQYFEDFLGLDLKGEVFVDVGGYDGSTSLEFIKRCPGYGSIHFFEPDKENMLNAQKRLSGYPSINYYNVALSDRKGIVRFCANGSSSSIDSRGKVEINADRLDNVINQSVSYVKMDIEGSEKSALLGAQQSIVKYHPRLAVSVYHKGDDLWRIPQQVLSYRNDYKIYLRHYTEGVTETVMFFIPR